jgi:glycine betaine/proline transport system permease protein
MTAVATTPAYIRVTTMLPKWAWVVVLFAVAAVLYIVFADGVVQPREDDRPFFLALNDLRDWIRENHDSPLFRLLFGIPQVIIDTLVEVSTTVLRTIGWPGLVAVAALVGYLAGGWRIAVLAAAGFLSLGILDLWESSVETLGAIIAAVAISYAIGVPLGILTARNARFARLISPVLDVMQIMPTFAYLAPFVLFFGIGPAAAAIVTLIYAMPAAIRITALGIRRVPTNTVEAGQSLGATGSQLLRKVRIPLARKELGLALNQTIMLALSMIVITALIAAPGLGQDTLRALIRNDVGAMFDAGIAIVILAIVLDRVTEHASERMDPRHRAGAKAGRIDRRVVAVVGAVTIVAIVAALIQPDLQDFPGNVQVSFREPVNTAVDWMRLHVAVMTGFGKDVVSYTAINPLQTVFTTSPFWLVVGVAAGLALIASGLREAVVAGACLVLIFLMGLWQDSMETLVQVLIATIITFALGLAIGIGSARSDRFAKFLRPILDTMQTMPSFVYILPAFVLFDASRFTAIVAAIVFAVPPVIRLVDVGLRSVSPTIKEAAVSSGASSRQRLTKVELPVARPALQLALNQAVILVLSMVVVGGLVGGQALGYDVVAGFSQNRLFGMGLAAGIALVLLGVMLDRMTHGASGRPSPNSR